MTDGATEDTATYQCDGYEYEHMTEYDLREAFDRFCFPKKLDTFINWRDDADEVHAEEEDGHMHYTIKDLEVKANVEEVSKRIRRIYWTVVYHG